MLRIIVVLWTCFSISVSSYILLNDTISKSNLASISNRGSHLDFHLFKYAISTIYTTSVVTIISCASTVTNYPAHSTTLHTAYIFASTTICPLTTESIRKNQTNHIRSLRGSILRTKSTIISDIVDQANSTASPLLALPLHQKLQLSLPLILLDHLEINIDPLH